MADIHFIIPPSNPGLIMPELGVPQLVAYLRQEGISCLQTDLNVLFIRKLLPRLASLSPKVDLKSLGPTEPDDFQIDAFAQITSRPNPVYERFFEKVFLSEFKKSPTPFVGISILGTAQVYPAVLLARLIKRAHPETRIILGGPWVTVAEPLLPDMLRALPAVDGAVLFGGERPLREMIYAFHQGRDFSEVPSLVWRDGDTVRTNPVGEGVPLGDLPMPTFEGLPLDLYTVKVLPLATEIGCYWGRCIFCHHNVESPTMTRRNPRQVVDYLEAMQTRYNARYFFFGDNCTHPDMMGDVAREITRRGLDLRWSAMARVETHYTREYTDLLYASGCRNLFIGFESINPEVLKLVRKGISIRHLETLLENFAASGVAVNLFIIDLPTLKIDYLLDTLEWIYERRASINDFILQRFILARNNLAFRIPETLGIIIPPKARTSLDVFNLPFEFHERDLLDGSPVKPMSDPEFFSMLRLFRKRFFEGKPGKMEDTDAWEACGRD